MLVQQILNSKPEQKAVTIAPDATISEAAQLMSRHRIGAVVVSSDGETVEGVLSERDIVRELARSGDSCLSGKVRDYMTREVETCAKGASADELLTRMTEGRFRHLPVVEDGKMIGVISIGDVVKAQLTQLEMEKGALEDMIKGF